MELNNSPSWVRTNDPSHGCREYHETAEFLDVTEEQLRDAIADYRSKYGVCTKYQDYYIMFEPYLMIGKKK